MPPEIDKFNTGEVPTDSACATSGASRLIRRCLLVQVQIGLTQRLSVYTVYLLKGEPAQPSHFLGQFDYLSSYSPWIYDNGQPARFSDSPIYRSICGKVRTPTLKLACLFNTVGWVNNHKYFPTFSLCNQDSPKIHHQRDEDSTGGLPARIVKLT